MRKLYTFVSIVLFCTLFSTVSAQDKCGVSIHLGGILPLGQFSEAPSYISPVLPAVSFNQYGAATFGASLGLRYNYAFVGTHWQDSGFGIFIAADLMWNALKKEQRKIYDQISCTKPMYVNVPIIIGGTWTSDFQRSPVNVWGEVGIGCNLFKKTSEGWENATIDYTMNYEFACEAGIGFIVERLFSVGIHYYWLGKQDIKVEGTSYGDGFFTPPTIAMHAMAFKVGFHF